MTYNPNVLKQENAKTNCNKFMPWNTTGNTLEKMVMHKWGQSHC